MIQICKILRKPQGNIRDLKHDDAFNTTWPSVLSTDKCCQVASLSIEITGHHVLLKALSCLRSLLCPTPRPHYSLKVHDYKVRIVYDGSVKTKKDTKSLNECLPRGQIIFEWTSVWTFAKISTGASSATWSALSCGPLFNCCSISLVCM